MEWAPSRLVLTTTLSSRGIHGLPVVRTKPVQFRGLVPRACKLARRKLEHNKNILRVSRTHDSAASVLFFDDR